MDKIIERLSMNRISKDRCSTSGTGEIPPTRLPIATALRLVSHA